jgi:hypothetical protein
MIDPAGRSVSVETDTDEWRFGNYLDHLADLGYELESGQMTAFEIGSEPDLTDAVDGYRSRSTPPML